MNEDPDVRVIVILGMEIDQIESVFRVKGHYTMIPVYPDLIADSLLSHSSILLFFGGVFIIPPCEEKGNGFGVQLRIFKSLPQNSSAAGRFRRRGKHN